MCIWNCFTLILDDAHGNYEDGDNDDDFDDDMDHDEL